ncbi:hypothetical protein [Enterocloster bolteae]|uniref:hypothetical protein n=1 Tax=Enterocloster bolteae TaxID=208479 RepID=UPI0028DC0520|nr:hypothetical protein [Enterocloster bolteae]
MRSVKSEHIGFQADIKTETKNWYLWVQHAGKTLYFSPADGFEKKEFKNQSELMQFAKACVSAGYVIG